MGPGLRANELLDILSGYLRFQSLPHLRAWSEFYVITDSEQSRFRLYHVERTFSFYREGRIRVLGCLPHGTKKVRRGMGLQPFHAV